MRRKILVLLVICLMLIGCGKKGNQFTYEVDFTYGEIEDIDMLFEEFMNKMWQANPEWDWQGTQFTDISFAFKQEIIDFYKETLEILLSFDTTNLSREQRLNRDLLAKFLSESIEGEKFLYHEYFIDQFAGIPISLPADLALDHEIDSIEDARNYIAKLKAFPWKLGQLKEGIKKQIELGIIPPEYIFSSFSMLVFQFQNTEPQGNILYTTFETKLEKCTGISEEDNALLKEDALAAIENDVYTAYQDLHEFLLPYLRDVQLPTVKAGVWELPQGDEYYAYLVRMHTTTDLSPQEIHDIGLREVERIHGEIREKLKEMGFEAEDPIACLREIVNKELITEREDILSEFRRVVEETARLLPEFFSTLPQAAVAVEPVPAFREDTYANAYRRPTGNQPGIFLVNLSYSHPKSEIEALAFHETMPGHHLQIALQLEAKLPSFRTMVRSTAYTEGWALYAEKLMYENGCYSSPLSELGYLQSELIRAARLVVDTGIHFKKWTREEALDYLWKTTGLKLGQDVNRYIIIPGQALAYKIGELKILELREMAKEQLGVQFDLREFHNVILSTGSVPLDILEQEVIRYIEEKKNTSMQKDSPQGCLLAWNGRGLSACVSF